MSETLALHLAPEAFFKKIFCPLLHLWTLKKMKSHNIQMTSNKNIPCIGFQFCNRLPALDAAHIVHCNLRAEAGCISLFDRPCDE